MGESLSIEGHSTSDGKVVGSAAYVKDGVVRTISLDCVELEPGSETHTVIGGDLRASGTSIDGVSGQSHVAHIRIAAPFGRLDAVGRVGISWDIASPEGMCGADNVLTKRPELGHFLFVRPVLRAGN